MKYIFRASLQGFAESRDKANSIIYTLSSLITVPSLSVNDYVNV